MDFKAMWSAGVIINNRDDLDTKERITLLAIARHADDKGRCFPRRKTLMKFTGLGVTATIAAIKGLVAKGLITSEERKDDEGQKSNLYTLLFSLDCPIATQSEGGTRRD